MAGKQNSFQKGQHYAAKYKGTGGDLILGQVESVRTSGHIVLTNLLTGATATKKAEVLKRRNKRISKSQAQKILAAFKKGGKEAARKTAIAAPEFRGKNEPVQLELPKQNLTKQQRELKEGDENTFARFFGQAMNDLQKDMDKLVSKHRLRLVRLLRDYGAEL